MNQKIILATLFVAFTVTLIPAYAEEIEVPFVADNSSCQLSYDRESNTFNYACLWSMTPTDEEIAIIAEDDPELVPEAIVDAIIEEQEIVIEEAKPQTPAEREIEKLTEKLEEDGYLPSHESQLLKALESYQEECEIGTEQGAPIQTYELFHIATYEPYTHTDLGTQYLLKKIETAIETCHAQKTLKTKILGDQYLHIPSTNEPKIIWQPTASLDDNFPNATKAYAENKMTDYWHQYAIDKAEGFKCSDLGKSMGHCRDLFPETESVDPVVSKEGKKLIEAYDAYIETGVTGIPKQVPDEEFDPTSALEQYIKAYGISEEALAKWYAERNP